MHLGRSLLLAGCGGGAVQGDGVGKGAAEPRRQADVVKRAGQGVASRDGFLVRSNGCVAFVPACWIGMHPEPGSLGLVEGMVGPGEQLRVIRTAGVVVASWVGRASILSAVGSGGLSWAMDPSDR